MMSNWFTLLPLRLKLIVPTWALLTCAIMGGGVVSISLIAENQERALFDRVNILTNGVASTLQAALMFDDATTTREQLVNLTFDPEIIAAQVTNNRDDIIATVNTLPNDCDWHGNGILCSNTLYQIHQTRIDVEGDDLGGLTVWISLNTLNEKQNSLWSTLILTTLVLSALSWLCARWLHNMIVQPLHSLSLSMREMSRDGFVKRELPIRHQDELGDLTHCFNDMVVNLREREHQLQLALKRVEEKSLYIYQALDAMEQGVMVVSPQNIVTYNNPKSAEELPSLNLHLDINYVLGNQFEPRSHVEQLLHAIESRSRLQDVLLRDISSERCFRFSCHPMATEQHSLIQFEDITEQQLAEHRRQMVELMFEQNQDATLVLSRDLAIETQNAVSKTWFGDIKHLQDLITDSPILHSYDVVRSTLLNGSFVWKINVLNQQSIWLPCTIQLRTLTNDKGKVAAFVLSISDRSKEIELKRLSHEANHDPLTGLANRSHASNSIQTAHDLGIAQHVFFLDLDGFKAVNDQYGHSVGDDLLRIVAKRLRHCVSETDLVARISGDEFLLSVRNVEDSTPIAERILTQLAKPVTIGEIKPQVSASIGIRYWSAQDPAPMDSVIHDADHAMYQAKRNGKNRFVVAAQRSNVMTMA